MSTSTSATKPNIELEGIIEPPYEKSIKENESRVYEFLIGKEKVVEKKDMAGNMVKKAQFIVIRQDDPLKEKRKLELSRVHVGQIYKHLLNGNKKDW